VQAPFTATITLRDGRAESILWNNGVTITRAAPVVDISGSWKSTIHVVYEITQKGEQFSWDAPLLRQKATGHISGKRVRAEWSGPGGVKEHAAGEVIADANSRGVRIRWDNTVEFFR
jgi:hypothetical protein